MTINIYLSSITEDKLTEIRKKYHVSLSTIAQILLDSFKPNFIFYQNEFFTSYLDVDHRNRTSIKPNNVDETSEYMQICKGEISTLSHIISNLLFLYAKKDFQYLFNTANQHNIEKWSREIEKEFLKKKEIYWNYNANLRQQMRVFRKNPQIFKKMMESM